MDYNMVDWYRQLLIAMKNKLQPISKLLVAKVFFAKNTFVLPLLEECFHVVSRLIGLKAYAKSLKRFIKVAVWYPIEGKMDKWQIYFSTDESMTPVM